MHVFVRCVFCQCILHRKEYKHQIHQAEVGGAPRLRLLAFKFRRPRPTFSAIRCGVLRRGKGVTLHEYASSRSNLKRLRSKISHIRLVFTSTCAAPYFTAWFGTTPSLVLDRKHLHGNLVFEGQHHSCQNKSIQLGSSKHAIISIQSRSFKADH